MRGEKEIITSLIILFFGSFQSYAETIDVSLRIGNHSSEENVINRANLIAIKNFIIKNGLCETYCQMYNNNPAYHTSHFAFYLNPDSGQNLDCEIDKSDFQTLVISVIQDSNNRNNQYCSVNFHNEYNIDIVISWPTEDLKVSQIRKLATNAIIEILRVAKDPQNPGGLSLLAKDDKWGKPDKGYVTQLIAQSEEYIVGKPMKFGLVLKNVGDSVKWYDPQAITHNTLIIKSADNNELYYKVGPFQTAANKHTIYNGEIATLFENRDITEEYLIIKPGKYTIQFRNGCYGKEIDSCFPLSNVIEFEVRPGTPDERDILISSLVSVLPDTKWQAVTSYVENRNAPPGRKNTEGIFVSVWHPIPNRIGGVIATLWQTKTPAEIDEQIKDARPSDYLGRNGSGYYYADIPPEALEYWPNIKEDIVKALKIDK